MQHFEEMFINNEWRRPAGTTSVDVLNPATEEVLASVPSCSGADIDDALQSAAGTFDTWSSTPLTERTAVLETVAEIMQARQDELAALVTSELGMPLRQSGPVQIGLPITTFASMRTAASAVEWEESLRNSKVVREPIGVVAAITPWNFPLHQIAAKLGPALAAGCTVVLKPSEVTSLNASVLMEVFEKAGAPPGIVNLVHGTGAEAGEALVSHPLVDMVSFTGSTRAGRRVSELAAGTTKRVSLELGGKSANVILDDADVNRAVSDGVGKCFFNSGQACNALTRMIVPRDRMDECISLAAAAAERYVVGDPLDRGTRLGPLVSARQRDIVDYYIYAGIDAGARVVVGGPGRPRGLDGGFYVRPTIFSDVTPDMAIAREEIFGPVLVMLPHDGDDDAIALANNSVYGLAGGVWSANTQRAESVARRIRAGQIDINGGAHNPVAPFGGYRQSGNGREYGRHGVEEFLEIKAIQF